jgi:acetyl esterase
VPAFRDKVDTLLLRAALNLPPGVQRAINRKPVVIDGQELSPEIQLLLTLKKLARVPAAETLPLEQARAELKRQQVMVGGRQPIGALRDLEVDGAEGPLRARLYIPTERTGPDPAPTLLFIHGGGWIYGDLGSHDPMCRFLAERSGVQLLSIDYRLSPEHPFPAAVEDCQAAYRWLVDHAEDVNADPARLAVGGDSAGGSLSLSTAVWAAEKGLPMAFQLLIYPGADFVERTESRRLFGQGFVLTEEFMTLAEQHYFTPGADKAHPDASGLRRIHFPSDLAPAHVVTAGYDPLRDEGEALARLLTDNGVEVDAKRYPSMIHGFAQIVGAGREARSYNAEIADRLRHALA